MISSADALFPSHKNDIDLDAALVKLQLLVKSCLPCTLRFHLFDPLFARPGLLPEASRASSTHNTLERSKVPQDRTPGTNVNTVLRVTNQLTVSGSKFRHIRSTEGGSQTSCLGTLYYEIRVNALIGIYVRSGRGS